MFSTVLASFTLFYLFIYFSFVFLRGVENMGSSSKFDGGVGCGGELIPYIGECEGASNSVLKISVKFLGNACEGVHLLKLPAISQ